MKREALCTLLGTTQDEMAMLLKINRSQWSMFESGKRDLPLEAKLALAEMLQHMKSQQDAVVKDKAKHHQEDTKISKKLEMLLVNNQYSQSLLAKKIERIEKKRTVAANALHLLRHLESKDKQHIDGSELLVNLQKKADTNLEGEALSTLVAHQIKQKVLQYEEELLKAALGK